MADDLDDEPQNSQNGFFGLKEVGIATDRLHRDLGRTSNALRDVGQGGRQGYLDGSNCAHKAGEEATKGAV
jgi:hypothetical protein